MREIVVTQADAGQRLDKYLRRLLKESGDGFIYKMLRKKRIKLNGSKAVGKEILNPDDVVMMYLADETIEKFGGKSAKSDTSPSLIDNEIIYEDDDILILDKPVGELSQKAAPGDISINERMLSYLNKTGVWEPGNLFTPGICNRLDRNTSGIILAGKTLAGTRLLSELIHDRKIRKYYIAVVDGLLEDNAPHTHSLGGSVGVSKQEHVKLSDTDGWMHIDGYLSKDRDINKVKIFGEPGDGRSRIQTAYRVIHEDDKLYNKLISDKIGNNDVRDRMDNGFDRVTTTLLEIELITGKTHQIRAHLASIGHPLSGDRKYGSTTPGQYKLCAYKVVFPDDERLSSALRGKEIIV